MKYTNFILTVIAILLVLHLAKPMILPTDANASSKVMDVNIVEIDGLLGRSLILL